MLFAYARSPWACRRVNGLRQAQPERLTEQYCDLAAIEKLAQQIRLSKDKAKPRHERLPQPSFSDALPKANRRAEIQVAIAANQVVIICGETGSGKTTQLPKI